MALTGSYIHPKSGAVCPNAYVVAEEILINRVHKNMDFIFAVYADQDARNRKAAAFDTIPVSIRNKPPHQQYDQLAKLVHDAENELIATRVRAQKQVDDEAADDSIPQDQKYTQESANDLIALAQSSLDQRTAKLNQLLGENWKERWPTFDEFFAKTIDNKPENPNDINATLCYLYAKNIPQLAEFVKA